MELKPALEIVEHTKVGQAIEGRMRGGDHRRSGEQGGARPLAGARIVGCGVWKHAEHGIGALHQRKQPGIAGAQVAQAPGRGLALALEGHENRRPRRQLGFKRRPDDLQARSVLGHGQDPPLRPRARRAGRQAELRDQQQVFRRSGGEAGRLEPALARPHRGGGGERARIAPAHEHGAHG